jgi:hypothetical protein
MLAAKFPFIPAGVLSTLSRGSESALAVILTSKALPYLIIGLGIVVRATQYFANRSLWLDEAFLALKDCRRCDHVAQCIRSTKRYPRRTLTIRPQPPYHTKSW